jgi:hypothetical protein
MYTLEYTAETMTQKLETCAWKTAEQQARGSATGGILRYHFLTVIFFSMALQPTSGIGPPL